MSIIWRMSSSRSSRCSSSRGGGRRGDTGIPAWQACGQLQRDQWGIKFCPNLVNLNLEQKLSQVA